MQFISLGICIHQLKLSGYNINMSLLNIAYAGEGAVEAGKFVEKLNEIILFPLIALLSGIAFLVFVYGGVVYIFNGTSDTAREEGKQHMMYGIIGLVVMISAWGLLSIAVNTFGLGKQLNCADDPEATGCENLGN